MLMPIRFRVTPADIAVGPPIVAKVDMLSDLQKVEGATVLYPTYKEFLLRLAAMATAWPVVAAKLTVSSSVNADRGYAATYARPPAAFSHIKYNMSETSISYSPPSHTAVALVRSTPELQFPETADVDSVCP
jgi:hypothetical protein